MNHHEQIRNNIDNVQQELEQLARISVDNQRMQCYEAGLQWIDLITGCDVVAAYYMPRTPEFWGFWKIVWLHADQEFLRWARYALSSEILERHELAFYYEVTHRITMDNDLINGPATEAGYHTVIKHLAVKR